MTSTGYGNISVTSIGYGNSICDKYWLWEHDSLQAVVMGTVPFL